MWEVAGWRETGFHCHHIDSARPFRTVTQQRSFNHESQAQSQISGITFSRFLVWFW